jgi:hypothetical protein
MEYSPLYHRWGIGMSGWGLKITAYWIPVLYLCTGQAFTGMVMRVNRFIEITYLRDSKRGIEPLLLKAFHSRVPLVPHLKRDNTGRHGI